MSISPRQQTAHRLDASFHNKNNTTKDYSASRCVYLVTFSRLSIQSSGPVSSLTERILHTDMRLSNTCLDISADISKVKSAYVKVVCEAMLRVHHCLPQHFCSHRLSFVSRAIAPQFEHVVGKNWAAALKSCLYRHCG